MKITKKVTSIVLALMLVISAFAGLSITASAVPMPTGNVTLTIHKYAMTENTDNADWIDYGDHDGSLLLDEDSDGTPDGIPAGANPLENVVFTIYKIGDMNGKYVAAAGETLEGTTVDTSSPATFTVPEGITGQDLDGTGDDGTTTFSVGSTDYGLYYVEEKSAPDNVTTQAVPFFVYLPMTDSEGDGWNTDVHVYPKNLTTLGSGTLVKQFGGATVSTGAGITFATNGAPVIEFYEDMGDDPDVKIATITLTGNDAVSVQEVQLDTGITNNTRYNGSLTGTAAVEVKEFKGQIAVNNLPTGTYYFKEIENSLTTGATLSDGTVYGVNAAEQSFTVTAGENQTATLTTESLTYSDGYDTNDQKTLNNSSTPTIEKEVSASSAVQADFNDGTVSAQAYEIGDQITYTLTPSIPTDIATYQAYSVTDTLSEELDFVANSVVVRQGEDVLAATTDYTITSTPNNDDNRTLTVALTSTRIADLTSTDTITVEFKAIINQNAVVNTAIPNTARVIFTNGSGNAGDDDSNTVYVATLGYDFIKIDSADNTAPLANAVFELYDGDDVVYVSAVSEVEGVNVYTVTTDKTTASQNTRLTTPASGIIRIEGLANKVYTLKEVEAPDGYQLLDGDLSITPSIDTNSGAAAATITGQAAVRGIENVPTPDLPLTGGMGTILFTVAGLVLIGGAAFFFIRSRKSSKEEA